MSLTCGLCFVWTAVKCRKRYSHKRLYSPSVCELTLEVKADGVCLPASWSVHWFQNDLPNLCKYTAVAQNACSSEILTFHFFRIAWKLRWQCLNWLYPFIVVERWKFCVFFLLNCKYFVQLWNKFDVTLLNLVAIWYEWYLKWTLLIERDIVV